MFFYKVWAFLKRDLRIDSSYKASYLFQFGGIFSSLFTYYFISKLMGDNSILDMEGYGGDYFSFVIIGIAFSKYQTAAMDTGGILIEEQEEGALEMILLTPTRIATLIAAGSLYPIIETSIIVVCYLLFGIFFFNMTVGTIDFLAVSLVTILSIVSFMGIGLMSTGFILVFKEGDPIGWFFGGISRFLGGVFFPIIILPEWVQNISAILPITYALEAMRGAVLSGKNVEELYRELTTLLVFAIILFPAGLFSLKYAVDRCRKDGSLAHY